MTPQWTAVRVDVSRHCNPEFLGRCGGKVYQVYLYNAHSVTHCCEITPSYELIPVDLVAEDYPEDAETREALYEELREVACADGDNVTYMHCRGIDALPDDVKRTLHAPNEDDAVEAYQGSPCF